jgi:malate dehydrogenase (oxaloacetate-decarboxylating)
MVRSMNHDPIIFAMANPIPEIIPQEAKEAGALEVGTGRSDFPNQINTVLAFSGIFRGVLDVHAKEINEEMKLAAVYEIAALISDEDLHADYVIPDPFDPRVAAQVAAAGLNHPVEMIPMLECRNITASSIFICKAYSVRSNSLIAPLMELIVKMLVFKWFSSN